MTKYQPKDFEQFFKDYHALYYRGNKKEIKKYWAEDTVYQDEYIPQLKSIKEIECIAMNHCYIPDKYDKDLVVNVMVKLNYKPEYFEDPMKNPIMIKLWDLLDLSGGECSPHVNITKAVNYWYVITIIESY